ncbi:MAG: cupin domain-containing protein [Jatrophihabitantaceae bacterium]
MRTFDSGKSDFKDVGPIQVARWEQQYQFGTELPFGAMWYTVPPGASSVRDCHPEPELSIVVAGAGVVQVASGNTEVSVGSAFLLDSEEAHVVHNHSTDTPLTIFSAYWMPLDSASTPADIATADIATADIATDHGAEPAGV